MSVSTVGNEKYDDDGDDDDDDADDDDNVDDCGDNVLILMDIFRK